MHRARSISLSALVLLLTTVTANAASWDLSAELELQSRLFTQDARWPGQRGQELQFSLAATAEARWRNAEGNQRMSLIPYARWDDVDAERSIFDLQEAYWAVEGLSLIHI